MSSWPPSHEPVEQITYRELALPPIQMAHLTVEEFTAKLKRARWKHVGDGVNSDVFVRGGWALKVSVNDYGYDAFLEAALQNQDNPFFPKIHTVSRYATSVKRDPFKAVMVTLVLMEELRPRHIVVSGRTSLRLERIGYILSGKTPKNAYWEPIKNISQNEMVAGKVLAKLVDEFGVLDLHQDNVMFRGKHPVIIDPVVRRYNHEHPQYHPFDEAELA